MLVGRQFTLIKLSYKNNSHAAYIKFDDDYQAMKGKSLSWTDEREAQ